ncbi:MAG: ethanolamine permease [Planctomycetota bacterium]|nr:ethanolamine permease [Planctomycetota bacterium]
MARKRRSGLASYEDVDPGYLEERRLRPTAGWVLLWALGVGAVISGDFYGWHFGLTAGGFGGLAIATLVMAAMYVCMVYSIAELSAALPHAGGFYSFVRNALGPTGGYICGLTDTIEYVLTPAVIVVGIGGYVDALIIELAGSEGASIGGWVWISWVVSYAIFVTINIRGVELTLKVGLVITLLAMAVLVAYYVSVLATGSFDTEKLFTVDPGSGQTPGWLPGGWRGVLAALPFAIWFFLAIEQLPLAAEETHDVVRDMPRALILGIVTLLLLSALTLVLNTGVGGGAGAMQKSAAPLSDGFRAVFPGHRWTAVFTLVMLTGLVASFHTIIYAYGRVLFALSRAGYFPRWMSLTSKQDTPHIALLLGAGVGLGCALAIHGRENRLVGAVLLNMAVFGAVISYALVMVSYIVLRVRRPDLPRPYRSPLGIPGAAVGALLALLALGATCADRDLIRGVMGVVVFLVLGLVYYFAWSRRRLVAQAPEEEAALAVRRERPESSPPADESPPG